MRMLPIVCCVSVVFVCSGLVWAGDAGVPPLSLAETDERAVPVPADEMQVLPTQTEPAPLPAKHSEVLADTKSKAGSATLAALIQEAIRNNGDVRASQADKDINLGRSHYERRNYFPRLLGNAHYKSEPDKDNNGQTERYYRRGYGVHADQMLWDFGETRGKVHKAYHEAESAVYSTELKKVDVAYDVIEAYWRAVMYEQIMAHREKALAALKRNAEAIEDQMKAKAAFAADHKNALSRVAKAEHMLIKAKNGLAVAKRRLLYLLGRDVEGDITLADKLAYSNPMTVPALNTEAHPDMKRVRELQKAADAARRSARGMLFPRLYFRGLWDYQYPEQNRGEVISQYGPKGYYYEVMLNVKIPIGMEWVAGRGKLKEAEAKQEQLQEQARALTEAIKYRVIDAKYCLQEAVKGLDVAEKRYAAAKAVVDLKKQLQGARKATQSDVANAEEDLEQAEIARFQALYDVKTAEANLLHEMGQIAGP